MYVDNQLIVSYQPYQWEKDCKAYNDQKMVRMAKKSLITSVYKPASESKHAAVTGHPSKFKRERLCRPIRHRDDINSCMEEQQ